MRFVLKACPKCGGDLYFDLLEEEYVCLQCALPVPFIQPLLQQIKRNLSPEAVAVC